MQRGASGGVSRWEDKNEEQKTPFCVRMGDFLYERNH